MWIFKVFVAECRCGKGKGREILCKVLTLNPHRKLQCRPAVVLMAGRFSFVPGTLPTFVIIVIAARDVVSGVFHVMNLDARTTLKRHIHEHVEGENKGEKEQ